MMSVVKIIVVDDHKIIADAIKSYLIGNELYEVCGVAESYNELMHLLNKRIIPDILMLDIKLKGISGIQIGKLIKKDYPDVKIIFLSSNMEDKDILHNAIKAGGKGFLSKNIDENELLEALNTVTFGGIFYDKTLRKIIMTDYTETILNAEEKNDDGLSGREVEILKLISDGLSHKEIADKLFISARTVETHRSNILKKLGLRTTAELIKYAVLNGYSDL